jgi:hypothetical protein
MYVSPNYKTKKAVKEALAAGKVVHVYQPNAMHEVAETGDVYLEGPHYPEPHRWYGKGVAQMGRLVSIK